MDMVGWRQNGNTENGFGLPDEQTKKKGMYALFSELSLNVLKFSTEFDLESTIEIMFQFQLKSHFVGT